VPIADHAC